MRRLSLSQPYIAHPPTLEQSDDHDDQDDHDDWNDDQDDPDDDSSRFGSFCSVYPVDQVLCDHVVTCNML